MARVHVQDDWTALHHAASGGDAIGVRALLEAGASLEATRAQTGANALLMAAHNGHVECAEALLKGGANPEATNNNGFTALLKAAQNGHASCVEALLKRGANPEATEPKWGATSLIQAAFAGQPESIRALLQGGAKLEATGKTRGTALHAAAQEGCAGCVEALLKGGANPQATDKKGFTALHAAAQNGHADCAEVLVRAGADPTYTGPFAGSGLEKSSTAKLVAGVASEVTVASVLDWHPAPNRARVAAWLAAQARDRGLRDVALLRGTRLRVNELGAGEYMGWEKSQKQKRPLPAHVRSKIGANKHFIRFEHGMETVSLRSNGGQWSVLPWQDGQGLCRARQLLAFVRGAVLLDGAHGDLDYDLLVASCELIPLPSRGVADRDVEDMHAKDRDAAPAAAAAHLHVVWRRADALHGGQAARSAAQAGHRGAQRLADLQGQRRIGERPALAQGGRGRAERRVGQ